MDAKTLVNVKNLLKASNYNFLDGDTAFQMFAEDVRPFTDAEVISGAKSFVRNPGKYPNYPALLEAIRNEHMVRAEYSASYNPSQWQSAVKCPKCNDNGYYFRYWKKDLGNGKYLYTETMRVCPCATGRTRFPSLLQTQAERDAWTFEAARKGGQPPKKLYDYSEEEFRAVVGEEITKRQYDAEFGNVATNRVNKNADDDFWEILAGVKR